jgi:hypothetical protein
MEPDRTNLIVRLYDWLYASTSSFEEGFDELGADALYLIGAIAKGTCCEWPSNRAFVRMLRSEYPEAHAIWKFIVLTEPECPVHGSRLNRKGFCPRKDCPYHRTEP